MSELGCRSLERAPFSLHSRRKLRNDDCTLRAVITVTSRHVRTRLVA